MNRNELSTLFSGVKIPQFEEILNTPIKNDNGDEVTLSEYLHGLNYTPFDNYFTYEDKFVFRLSDFYTKKGTRDFNATGSYAAQSDIDSKFYQIGTVELSDEDIAKIDNIRILFKTKHGICRVVFDKAVKTIADTLYSLSSEDDTKNRFYSNTKKAQIIHEILLFILRRKYGNRVSEFPTVSAIRALIPTKIDKYEQRP